MEGRQLKLLSLAVLFLSTVCGLLLGLRCSPTQSDRIPCSCKLSHIIEPVVIRWWKASERAGQWKTSEEEEKEDE